MIQRLIAFICIFSGSLYAKKDIWVNIYIHGTIKPRLSLCDFFKTINDTAHNSMYAEITRLVRTDQFFHLAQPIQEIGLKKAYPTKEKKDSGAYVFSKSYEKISKMVNPETAASKHYTFGWSGLLTRRARRQSAKKLYELLSIKVKHLRKEGCEPHIRMIGYSHGGNIALLLGEEARAGKQSPFSIDELILISTPIQEETKSYVNNRIFKKVYNFYSAGDHVQTGDFLSSFTHSFGHRTFLSTDSFKRTSKITQVQVRFIRKKMVIPQSDGSSRTIYRTDYINPSHTEMFFFGWAAEWYRRHFPIKPLSVALIIPIIQYQIEKHDLNGKNIRATIVPEEEKMILAITGQKDIITPFLTKKELGILKKEILAYQPKDYKSRYHKRVNKIKIEAKKIHKEKINQRKARKKLKEHNKKHQPIKQPPMKATPTVLKNLPSSSVVRVEPISLKK